jgi:hypothetical protein
MTPIFLKKNKLIIFLFIIAKFLKKTLFFKKSLKSKYYFSQKIIILSIKIQNKKFKEKYIFKEKKN